MMNMARKRSPRKKRNECGIHFDTMEWWMFSSTIFGILLVTLSDATSIPLQNKTQQNPDQGQNNSTDNGTTTFLELISNEFKTNIYKNESTKMHSDVLNITGSLNETDNININGDLRLDSVSDFNRTGNNSNLLEIHIRVIDKRDPVNGAPLLNIDTYKYDIDSEISTQYQTIYNSQFENDPEISTTEISIDDLFDNDYETTTDAIFTTTNEAFIDSTTYQSAIEKDKQFRDELLNADSTEKNLKEILPSTTFGSRFAVTTPTPLILSEKVIHKAEVIKKEENVTTHNISSTNSCSENEKYRNDIDDVKVGEVLNMTSNGFVEINSKLQEIATENNAYADFDSEENMVGNVEIDSHKMLKLKKKSNQNSTRPYSKKDYLHQSTTKKYFPLIRNTNDSQSNNLNVSEIVAINTENNLTSKIIILEDFSDESNSETTTIMIESEDDFENITTEKWDTNTTNSLKDSIGIQGELNIITSVKNNVTDLDIFKNFTTTIGDFKNVSMTNNNTTSVIKMKNNATEEFKNSTKIVNNFNNKTNFNINKNAGKIGDEFRNISSARKTATNVTSVKISRHKSKKIVSDEKLNSHEVTTEEDYNSSYEMEEDDDLDSFIMKNKSMTEPLDMGPFGALRDLAGSFMESLVERIVPQSIRDLMRRMQNQNTQLETIKLRSREENGGLGQFGRSLLKGLTQPLNQWMQGVRDYGSLDSDRNFFSDVASGVASVADSVGDSFKDRVKAIFPGTLWCGDGDMAKSAEVGLFFMTDNCCRRHDTCRLYIVAGDTKYGLTNTGIFTRSHCECDKAFYRCLKRTNSLVSSQIGVTYFSILGPQCFKREHPIMRCMRRTRLTGQKCEEYELDHSQPKMWQWFDTETF